MEDVRQKSIEQLEERMAGLDRLVQEQMGALQRALCIQAAEYARRLDELNHAYNKASDDRREFVHQDPFEVWKTELTRWREHITVELAETRGAAASLARSWSISIGVVVVLLNIVARLLL